MVVEVGKEDVTGEGERERERERVNKQRDTRSLYDSILVRNIVFPGAISNVKRSVN